MKRLLLISLLLILLTSCTEVNGIEYPPCVASTERYDVKLNCNCVSNKVLITCHNNQHCSDINIKFNNGSWLAANNCIISMPTPIPLPEPSLPQITPTPTPVPIPSVSPTIEPIPSIGVLRIGLEFFSCRVTGIGNTRMVANATPRIAVNSSDTTGIEQPKDSQDPNGIVCTQSRKPADGWSSIEVMENSSGNPYMCQTNLAQQDAGREYTFRAYPRSSTKLGIPPNNDPNFQRYGEVKVFFESRGKVRCIERWNGSKFVPCTEKDCG